MPVYATGRVEQFVTDPITGVVSTAPGVKGISVNTVNGSISEYLNYPFNSFATLNGKMLGANENGLYLREGDDDDGTAITAIIRIALQDFGDSFLKRLKACYLGIKVVGTMVVKSVDETGTIQSTTSAGTTSAGYETIRAKLGRGVKSRYWAIDVSNNDGEDFSIDTLELERTDTTRRIG